MHTVSTRRLVALAICLALAVGAALPPLTDAAVRLARGSVGTLQLRSGAVTDAKVRRGSLRYTAFARGQVARADLRGIRAGGVLTGTFPRPGLARGSVRATQIATGAVGSAELAAGAVRASDIANGSIGASKLAPNSIGQGQIARGGVGASEIAAGAVGTSELAHLPGGRAYRSTALALASGALVEVALTDVDYARAGVWDGAHPARLTAPVAGVYQITAGAVFAASAVGARAIWIAPTGDAAHPYAGAQQPATAGGAATALSAAVVVHLDAGASVSLVAQQTSGGSLSLLGTGQATGLTLQLLGP